MTDPDDDIIRLSPSTDIQLAVFAADTTIGTIETPILQFQDERLGEVHILLNPVDNAAVKLCGKLVHYVNHLVDQLGGDDEC
ncbi:hypothetical protein [Gordonia sp. NPDC003429]